MTIPLVQYQSSGLNGSHASNTATFDSPPTPGHTLVLDIAVSSLVIQKVVSVPAGWTERKRLWTNASCVHLLCTRVAEASEPSAVTVTFDSTPGSNLIIGEVDGAYGDAATDIDLNSTTVDVPPVTPAAGVAALLLVFASASLPYGVTAEPSGYTNFVDIAPLGGNDLRLDGWYQNVATTSGSYTGSISYSNGVQSTRIHVWFTGTVVTGGVIDWTDGVW